MTTATKSPVKLTLGDFTVELLGVEYPDYFQGYGLGPSTEYTGCCYGIGNTEAEALEDCLEMFAQSGCIEVDDETEKRIRDEYGRADDNVTAADELGINEDTDVPLCGPDSTFDESPAYWHVGIKWNIREEQRYKRIRKIEGIQPLRYEDYQPLNRSERSGVFGTWGYVRRADGSASYGDFKETDWPESAEAYLGSLCEDTEETGECYFYVPHASGSDYSGSTVEKANAKCIEDSYEEQDWVHSVYGGHSTYAVAIGVTGLLGCDKDTFDELCETLEGLADYPCIDDEAVSELEMEGADEAWDSWCKDDFTRALEEEYKGKAEFKWPDDSALREFFEEKRENVNTYWYCEGYGHDMYVDIDEVVKGITFDDVVKWAVRYEVSYNDGGERREVCYREDDAIERTGALRADGILGASYKILETGETDTN